MLVIHFIQQNEWHSTNKHYDILKTLSSSEWYEEEEVEQQFKKSFTAGMVRSSGA